MNRSNSATPFITIVIVLFILGLKFWRRQNTTPPANSPQTRQPAPKSRGKQADTPPASTGTGTDTAGTTGTATTEGSNDGNLLLGNASKAATEPDNFLLERKQYTLSYNQSRGEANWVAWHVEGADLGSVERGKFRPDPDLSGDMRVTPNDYKGSGFDRGHMCPSADRAGNREDNDTTFYMSNMVPQTAELNQHVWADFENYVRDVVREGNEVYQICGPEGNSGSIADGKVTVPASCWKIVVVLPEGSGDLNRISAKTRVIALSMPNTKDDSLRNGDWHTFLTTPKDIETSTGLDFFSTLPPKVASALEAKKDAGD